MVGHSTKAKRTPRVWELTPYTVICGLPASIAKITTFNIHSRDNHDDRNIRL